MKFDAKRCKKLLPVVLVTWTTYVIICAILFIASNKEMYRSLMEQKISSVHCPNSDDISGFKIRQINMAPTSIESLHTDRSGISTAVTIWCGQKVFEFKHFLTLLSITKILKSDVIWFMYEEFPKSDTYNQWLNQISSSFPFLRFEKCKYCCRNKQSDLSKLIEIMTIKGGGIYISFDVIIVNFTKYLHDLNAFTIRDKKDNIKISMMKPLLIPYLYEKTNTGLSYFNNESVYNGVNQTPSIKCNNMTTTNNNTSTANHCYDLTNYNGSLYPQDIWYGPSDFSKNVRHLMYNNSKPVEPIISDYATPRIVHYVWYARKQMPMSFMFYLSVLSFVYIGQIQRVYIHCNYQPKGYLWEKLNKDLQLKHILYVVYRTNPQSVFNQTVGTVQHMADVAKADISYKYGGLISDIDVLLVKPIDPDLFQYDFVVGKDVGKYHSFPDAVNMGIIISKPGNHFSKMWINSMKSFHDDDWLWNAGLRTYKIIENYPHLVYITNHLQVIVYHFKFHPTWVPKHEYQNITFSFKNVLSFEDWIKQTHSFHFTFPEPFVSISSLKEEQGLVGQIGRFVAKQVGIL